MVARGATGSPGNRGIRGIWTRAWRVVLPVALLIVFASWATTSPVGSSPDDDYHLSSIWCAGGERAGVCESDPEDSSVRLVPQSVGFAHECFAYDASITAACTAGLSEGVVATDRVNNVQGLYPTLFYRTMHVFVGDDPQRSVLAMRMFNAVLFVALMTLALWVLTPAIRSTLVGAVLVVFIPLGLFIIPSTNPSSWTITGLTLLWAFGLALARRRSWRSPRTWLLAVVAGFSALLAIGSRVDASAFVALVVVVVVLLTGIRRARTSWISIVVLLVFATVGLLQYATFGTPRSGFAGGMGGTEPGPGLLFTNIVYLPVYISGAVGGMALGWNDTALPPLVFVFGLLALGALLARGLEHFPRSKATALAVSLAALIVVPLVFLQREGLAVGEVVQARYLLPLIIVFVLTVSLAIPFGSNQDRGLGLSRALAWVLGLGLGASASIALWVNAHRYAAGIDRGLFDIDLVLEWTGMIGLPLPLIVGIGVLATIAYVAAAVSGIRVDGPEGSTGRTGSRTTAFRLVR